MVSASCSTFITCQRKLSLCPLFYDNFKASSMSFSNALLYLVSVVLHDQHATLLDVYFCVVWCHVFNIISSILQRPLQPFMHFWFLSPVIEQRFFPNQWLLSSISIIDATVEEGMNPVATTVIFFMNKSAEPGIGIVTPSQVLHATNSNILPEHRFQILYQSPCYQGTQTNYRSIHCEEILQAV